MEHIHNHTAINGQGLFVLKYPLLSIASNSSIQLGELEQNTVIYSKRIRHRSQHGIRTRIIVVETVRSVFYYLLNNQRHICGRLTSAGGNINNYLNRCGIGHLNVNQNCPLGVANCM